MGWGDTRRPAALVQRAAAFARWAVRLLGAHHHSAISPISNFVSRSFSRREIVFAVLISCAAVTALVSFVAVAQERPFSPIRKLTTPDTDRSLVDIEIVGSTSRLPEVHKLEPERMLRFRLERAYIYTLNAKAEPGFEIVSLLVDVKTGLPTALFDAVSLRGKFHEDIPGIPDIPRAELLERTLLISLTSEMSAAALRRGSEGIAKCLGAKQSDELFEYNWNGGQNCFLPSYTRGSQYVGLYENNIFLRIMCENNEGPRLDCELTFPFEGFGIRILFSRVHLASWRDMIGHTVEFLKSKQYR
jgi:hypothetical protein